MPSYVSVTLSQKQFLKNLLCCSTLINNSKEKLALEKGGYKDFQVQGVPQLCKIHLLQNKAGGRKLSQTKETVRKKKTVKISKAQREEEDSSKGGGRKSAQRRKRREIGHNIVKHEARTVGDGRP